MPRERMTEDRKVEFLRHLDCGCSFREAALLASRHATTLDGAQSSFRQAMKRDVVFALRVAKVRSAR